MWIRMLSAVGLAKVLRVAPTPVVAPASHVNLETVRAVIVNRMHVLRAYTSSVTLPVFKAELQAARGNLTRRVKKLLVRQPVLLDDKSHAKLNEVLASEWARARRSEESLALIMIDIDYFKPYNDHYGHGLGDDCLRQVAAVLAEALPRGGDLAARYGGEEFAAILPACDVDGAVAVAERIRAGIAQRRIAHAASITAAHVTISAGCASTLPEPEDPHTGLVAAADAALYEAKRSGRDRVCAA